MIEAKASKHSSTSASDSTALNATSQSNGSGGTNQLPARGDVRIGVISDLNSQYGSTSYEPEVTKAIGWRPDIVLSGGDMVAGQSPTLSTEEIKAIWTAFEHHSGRRIYPLVSLLAITMHQQLFLQ